MPKWWIQNQTSRELDQRLWAKEFFYSLGNCPNEAPTQQKERQHHLQSTQQKNRYIKACYILKNDFLKQQQQKNKKQQSLDSFLHPISVWFLHSRSPPFKKIKKSFSKRHLQTWLQHLKSEGRKKMTRKKMICFFKKSSKAKLQFATCEPIIMSGWWFQPTWKILVKKGVFPQVGLKITHIWNHHPDMHNMSFLKTNSTEFMEPCNNWTGETLLEFFCFSKKLGVIRSELMFVLKNVVGRILKKCSKSFSKWIPVTSQWFMEISLIFQHGFQQPTKTGVFLLGNFSPGVVRVANLWLGGASEHPKASLQKKTGKYTPSNLSQVFIA